MAHPKSVTSVAIFGAGIAGLTAAHELARQGYTVSVYEALEEAGGFFRSAREARMPTEYSWHGIGPWYHNTFDLFSQIPFDESGSLYERALSRPIDFGIFPDRRPARFYDRGLRSIPAMFGMGSVREVVGWTWLMLKAWTAQRRSRHDYSRINAARAWSGVLGHQAARTWRASFGPWIGSDWTRVSLHTAGRFFLHQLTSRPTHLHPPDRHGPAWRHGAGDGWLLLRGPSSEFWFDRWLEDLRRQGVKFHWNRPVRRLVADQGRVARADLENGETVLADHFVLAIDPFSTLSLVQASQGLEHDLELRRFGPLTQDGPHTQVSFRIAFDEEVHFPRERTAVVVADSEFNLTLFAEEQAWAERVDLGPRVKSLWTGTACAAEVPGRVHRLPLKKCTKQQFLEEVKAQLLACGALDEMIREANQGRGLSDLHPIRVEVWHEWKFGPGELRGSQPKWVNTTHTQSHQPGQTTSFENLFLSGAHTRTSADVWSIEAAIESGRLAARAIDPGVRVLHQYRPPLLETLGNLDDRLYEAGLPHLLDLSLFVLAGLVLLLGLR
ncbi:MAG: FAD-dependent oxidoreductase [Candidatus Eremiobacteraeota bacterium]|nr:FAD-dependent oxidoreductase [Candidatus Eremiobacteraeota bacterium]